MFICELICLYSTCNHSEFQKLNNSLGLNLTFILEMQKLCSEYTVMCKFVLELYYMKLKRRNSALFDYETKSRNNNTRLKDHLVEMT